jgi:GTP pyrophosphokinase
MLPAQWDEATEQMFRTGIDIWGLNRVGILNDVTQVLSDFGISVNDVRITYPGDDTAKIELAVDVANSQELNTVIRAIRGIPDIVDAARSKG